MIRQRGALMFVTPMLMIIIIMLGVLALDGARLYSLRQEMQSIANTAATGAVNAAQSCSGRRIDLKNDGAADPNDMETLARSVVEEQLARLGGELKTVEPGVVKANDTGELTYRQVSKGYESNAVRVVYEKQEVPLSSLVPGLFGDVTMQASAVAKKEVVATIGAAGSTAVIGGTDESAGILGSLLGGLLGVDELDATSVKSLANTTFELGAFLDSLGVSEGLTAVDDLVRVDQVLRAILAGIGESASGAAGTVQDILEDEGLVNTNVRLDDVIKLLADVQYPDKTQVPVYDTVVALALNLASGLLEVPLNVDLNVGESVSAYAYLLVNAPPTVAVGPARTGEDGLPLVRFNAADIFLGLEIDVKLLGGLLKVHLPLLVETGGGSGYLASARCASGSLNQVQFDVWLRPKTALISTSTISSGGAVVPDSITAEALGALRDALVSLEVRATLPRLEVGSSVDKFHTFAPYELSNGVVDPIKTDAGFAIRTTLDETGSVLDIEVQKPEESCGFLGLGCVLDAILEPILDVVEGTLDEVLRSGVLELLGEVLNTILTPILNALGLQLGGMTATLQGASQGAVVLLECSDETCESIELGQ